MDLRTLAVGAEPVKESTATAVSVTLGKFQNGNGKPLKLDLLPYASPEGRQQIRRWQMKFGIGKTPAAYPDASEEELDELADRDKDSNVELMARVVAGWNLEDGKNGPVECSLENRKMFLEAFPAVTEQVGRELTKISEKLGNSKTA